MVNMSFCSLIDYLSQKINRSVRTLESRPLGDIEEFIFFSIMDPPRLPRDENENSESIVL